MPIGAFNEIIEAAIAKPNWSARVSDPLFLPAGTRPPCGPHRRLRRDSGGATEM
jgi:hypothetical protein